MGASHTIYYKPRRHVCPQNNQTFPSSLKAWESRISTSLLTAKVGVWDYYRKKRTFSLPGPLLMEDTPAIVHSSSLLSLTFSGVATAIVLAHLVYLEKPQIHPLFWDLGHSLLPPSSCGWEFWQPAPLVHTCTAVSVFDPGNLWVVPCALCHYKVTHKLFIIFPKVSFFPLIPDNSL